MGAGVIAPRDELGAGTGDASQSSRRAQARAAAGPPAFWSNDQEVVVHHGMVRLGVSCRPELRFGSRRVGEHYISVATGREAQRFPGPHGDDAHSILGVRAQERREQHFEQA